MYATVPTAPGFVNMLGLRFRDKEV